MLARPMFGEKYRVPSVPSVPDAPAAILARVSQPPSGGVPVTGASSPVDWAWASVMPSASGPNPSGPRTRAASVGEADTAGLADGGGVVPVAAGVPVDAQPASRPAQRVAAARANFDT